MNTFDVLMLGRFISTIDILHEHVPVCFYATVVFDLQRSFMVDLLRVTCMAFCFWLISKLRGDGKVDLDSDRKRH